MRTPIDDAPPRVLVVYAGAHGHTERITRRVVEVLEHEGLDVDLVRLRALGRRAAPSEHDGVIVCAPVRALRRQPALRRWLVRRRDALNLRLTALLAIDVAPDEPQNLSHARAVAWIAGVRRATGWRPTATLPVAGAQQAPYTGFTGPQLAGFTHRTAAEIRSRVERDRAERRLSAGARATAA